MNSNICNNCDYCTLEDDFEEKAMICELAERVISPTNKFRKKAPTWCPLYEDGWED